MIPDELLSEWERLCEAATPGPWEFIVDEGGYEDLHGPQGEHVVCFGHDYGQYGDLTSQDAHFIAAARVALPQLIKECRRMKAALNAVHKLIEAESCTKEGQG